MGNEHQEAARANEKSDGRSVVVRGSSAGFAQEIVAGPHRRAADEPVSVGAPAQMQKNLQQGGKRKTGLTLTGLLMEGPIRVLPGSLMISR